MYMEKSLLMLLILTVCAVQLMAAEIAVSQKKLDTHTVVDMRSAMNNSCFDDGVADNGEGGWTDEGLNDFRTYPALTFGAKKYRGYFFDFVDPKTNNGKNLLMTGTAKTWPKLPRKIKLTGLDAKGKYIFIMHSEGRMTKASSGGKLILGYGDGTKAELELRIGKELGDWFQGRWWSNCEVPHEDAPEALKQSNCDPARYKKLGGKNFNEDVLKHATAVRWPVTQGTNQISLSWNIPVVFWALKWKNPNPGLSIKSISLESSGKCLIAVAAITISDRDFSLDRQTLGKMRKPPSPPTGFFQKINASLSSKTVPQLIKQTWTKGIRDVQIRSDRIVTVRVDHIADFTRLEKSDSYLIKSNDDQDFADGIKPDTVSRFSRASRYRAVKGQPKVYVDHWMHLQVPGIFKPGKNYTLELINKLIPKSDKLKRTIEFSFDKTPNPSFKLNQVGYSAASGVKHVYLSSYLGDGKPVNLDRFKAFEIRDARNGKKAFSGVIKLHVEKDIQGLDKLYLLDISSFRDEGEFYIWVDGLGRSYSFKNGVIGAKAMYDVCHRGLFFQRAGIEIKEPFAGKWPRPMAHNRMYVTKKNITHPFHSHGKVDPKDKNSEYYVPEGPQEIHGGHYDAGDYDLRAMHINIPELLLSLYEACPEKFYDGQVNIPENRNGVPDILDEAAWNLLSLEYIQDYATKIRGLDGGVAPGFETYTHPGKGNGMGKDDLPYYMRKVTGYFSFSASAAFAQAARLIKPFDEKRAARYLTRAKRAYRYAVEHKDDPQPVPLKGGKTDQGEGWSKQNLSSAWCWAAGQLFSTTGEIKYLDEFRSRYKKARGGVAGSVSEWAVLWGIMASKQEGIDREIIQELKQRLLRAADSKLNFVEERGRQGYRASTPKGGGWGSTSCVVRNIEAVTRAYLLTKDQKYLDAIATSVDFSLGMNPSEISWMTGAGTAYPMDPCSLNSLDDGVEDPLPGILIYGPTNYWFDSKVQLYPDKKQMGYYRRVVDAWGMISQCEYTVWETQAPFIFAVGTLLPDRP